MYQPLCRPTPGNPGGRGLGVDLRKTTCKLERTLKAIEADEQYDANDAHRIRLYRNRDIPASAIGRELRMAGFNVSTTRIKEHFIGDCNCRIDL